MKKTYIYLSLNYNNVCIKIFEQLLSNRSIVEHLPREEVRISTQKQWKNK